MKFKPVITGSFLLYIFSALCCLQLLSCNGNKLAAGEDNRNTPNHLINELPTIVKTIHLTEGNFNRELLANGKLEASRKANLKFSGDGIISSINVKENDRVNKGQTLAGLDKTAQLHSYNQAKLRYRQAILDYEDQLLRLGFRLTDTSRIDKNTQTIAKIRSGLSSAQLELQKAKADFDNTNLIAPFSGNIANLKGRLYNNASSSEYFCTLINDSELTVEFLILEQELNFIRNANTVMIVPFNNEHKRYTGIITSVNPTIDKSGMLSVKARVSNTGLELIDGMSVKIKVQQAIHKQLIIPKTALLERQGRKVVFTRKNKTAFWNYVEVAYENSNEFAIKSGLKPGDEVIYDGNFNLAHNKPIEVEN